MCGVGVLSGYPATCPEKFLTEALASVFPQGEIQTYPFVVDAGKENFSRATTAAIPPSWQETFVSLFQAPRVARTN